MSGQDKLRFLHLGAVVMWLRQTAGLSRKEFSSAVRLSDVELKAFECRKRLLTVEQRQRILRHPVIADAHRLATESGIELAAEGLATPKP